MCGIAGFWRSEGPEPFLAEKVKRMADALEHRGPDDSGVWVDPSYGIALGHRRLSILDLSVEGHQPRVSASGRFVVTYNGEVYNFQLLRRDLEAKGHVFRGYSDTEVMLAAFEEWGIESALQQFVGMFAFGVWDRQECMLHLVRDRLGIKPLYLGWAGKAFLFGSELKGFHAYPDFKAQINRDALALYLRYGYVPAPYTIYQNAYKLLPGCILTVRTQDLGQRAQFSPFPDEHGAGWKPKRYWSAREVTEAGSARPFTGSEKEAVTYLDGLLREAVHLRMVSDVPLGAFLSGGSDSSTIVALMQTQTTRRVKTFTIGFHEPYYNEARWAKKIADYIGTDHTEFYVTPEEAMAVIPKLPTLYDEPFADSSQIPTYLVSQLARSHVTVSLSGDGGDELWGGYDRYFWANAIRRTIDWAPKPMRSALARALTRISSDSWDETFKKLVPILPVRVQPRNPGHKLHEVSELLSFETPEALYQGLVSHWKKPELIALDSRETPTVFIDRTAWPRLPDFISRIMYLDTVSYLPDDLLVKLDRASMGVSLEARVPLLDHRVVEFAWRLPLSMKIRNGQSKWLLRQVLYRYVPRELVDRPKRGFGVPIGLWLRGPLREWAEELLDVKRMKDDGYFNPEPIRQKWSEHLSGQRAWQDYLWDVLMFQAWKERWC